MDVAPKAPAGGFPDTTTPYVDGYSEAPWGIG